MRAIHLWWARQRALHRNVRPFPPWVRQVAASLCLIAFIYAFGSLPFAWARSAESAVAVAIAHDSTGDWWAQAQAIPQAIPAWGASLGLSQAVSSLGTGGPDAPPDALPTGLGRLQWPLIGAVVSPFGFRGAGSPPEYHQGIDIAAAVGSEVSSIAAGRVAQVERDRSGLGYEVVMQHKFGWTTVYAHLTSPRVTPGMAVAAGTVLGTLAPGGDDGKATGGVLHFELRQAGQALDPAPYLGLLADAGS